MKILMVHPGPEFSVADVFNGWKKAFEAQGHRVKVYNTHDRLNFYSQAHMLDHKAELNEDGTRPFRKAMDNEQACAAAVQGLTHELYEYWPHMVFFVSAFFMPHWIFDLIRQRKHRVVILHTESPYQDDEQLMRAQYAHVNLLNDPVNLEEYAQLAPAMYMPHAYDPDIHYPGAVNEKDVDFSFIGTMFESRRIFFEDLLSQSGMSQVKIAMGGSGWDGQHLDGSPLLDYLGHPRNFSVDNTDTADMYRRSRLGINFYRRESEAQHQGEGWAMGPREVELAACGIPFLRDSRPESDEVFPFLPTFSDAGEAHELLQWYLTDEHARNNLGCKARLAIEDRTFGNHATMLMRELEKAGLL